MTYDKIKSILQEAVCIVDFTKVNGENRLMKCTLMEDYMPPVQEAKGDGSFTPSATTTSENTQVLAVWDLQNNGWRSFRIDGVNSIIKVE